MLRCAFRFNLVSYKLISIGLNTINSCGRINRISRYCNIKLHCLRLPFNINAHKSTLYTLSESVADPLHWCIAIVYIWCSKLAPIH